ncbi:hypothetical protein GJV44_00536 [Candidatus Vallotia cooleyia]|nr:hypothetical protein GJV44_00536 [Candidatus Vallotia cooleyia]
MPEKILLVSDRKPWVTSAEALSIIKGHYGKENYDAIIELLIIDVINPRSLIAQHGDCLSVQLCSAILESQIYIESFAVNALPQYVSRVAHISYV